MVKGVNKQIIEINDTGNSYFEKVLLFVAPGKSDKTAEKLKSEAKSYLLNLSSEYKTTGGIREHIENKKKRKTIFLACLVSAVLLAAVTMLILNIV